MGDEKRKGEVENQFEGDQKSNEAIMRRASKQVVEEYQKNENPNNFSDDQHNTLYDKSRTGSHLQINHSKVVSGKQVHYPSRNNQEMDAVPVLYPITDTQDILNESTDSNKVQTVREYVKKELVLRKILTKSDIYGRDGLRVSLVRLEPYIAAPATLTLNSQFGEVWVMELVENKRGRFLRKEWKKYAARHRLKIGDTIIIQRTLVMKQVLDISPKTESSSSAGKKPEELAKSEVLRTKYDIIIE
ncbi:uncharacterized protein [Nicotiana sylvestris]|uniref:Uncharacterized protein LOC104238941 n=1 Tax=Nicotiana sylvestris TaxID=4096 RepID=A0A1U7XQ63_NICSY|nr:PREDICTED: uncharacterized protein LOC104238941 [Nicotiana sylvestris]